MSEEETKSNEVDMSIVNESLIKANKGIERHIILADPPWQYAHKNERMGSTHKHYNTLSLKHLLELDVDKIAAKDCALLVWVTSKHIPTYCKLIETWGFTHITVLFSWVKVNPLGLPSRRQTGLYTRQQEEWIYLATRGMLKSCLIIGN